MRNRLGGCSGIPLGVLARPCACGMHAAAQGAGECSVAAFSPAAAMQRERIGGDRAEIGMPPAAAAAWLQALACSRIEGAPGLCTVPGCQARCRTGAPTHPFDTILRRLPPPWRNTTTISEDLHCKKHEQHCSGERPLWLDSGKKNTPVHKVRAQRMIPKCLPIGTRRTDRERAYDCNGKTSHTMPSAVHGLACTERTPPFD